MVTALTLHADEGHLLGNAVSAIVFVTAVCRAFGSGVGMWLVLLAGVAGNAASAAVHDPTHEAVGASTALFGALGILGALQAWRRAEAPARRGPWVPLAASLGVLAMLGTGGRADLAAHFFGFAAGLGVGAAAAPLARRPPGRTAQRLLLGAALGAVVGAWMRALR